MDTYNSSNVNKDEELSVVIERLKSSDGKAFDDPDYKLNETKISTSAFLLKYPRGAYTSARTVKRVSIMDLQGHIDRTVRSLKLMKFIPEKENLMEKNQDNDDDDNNNDHEESPQVKQELAPYRDSDTFKQMIVPLLKVGLSRYCNIEEESSPHHREKESPQYPHNIKEKKGEVKVTILACYSFEEQRPILVAHFTVLQVPNSPRCKVEVYGEPRKAAVAKDSQWVRDRKALESSMHPGFNEILLSDSHTHNIYEGLNSNFFVVLHNPDTREPLVVTAPLQYVIEGTILKIVRMICERDKIDLQFWFPNANDTEHWEGAFLTSTSRLVLPIELIKFRDERPIVKLPTDNETIEHIKKEVEKEIHHRAYRILW